MSAQSILNAIESAANTSLAFNFVMHVLVLGAICCLLLAADSKTRQYVLNGIFLTLAISVAVICLVNGNLFNLVTFAVIATVSTVELFRGKNRIGKLKADFNSIASFVFILIGFVYPDFVKANPALLPFVSPLGAIPCPTLLVMLGMLNLSIPHVNRVQFVTTTVLALFYGITGVFQLGVYLDIALLVLALYSIYNFRFVFGRKKLIGHEMASYYQSESGEIHKTR